MARRISSSAGTGTQHPTGDPLPSDTDRLAWLRGCQLTRSHWVSLIFAPAAGVRLEPDYAAYITKGSGSTFYCERLHVDEVL
jgi:hypothetical protein